MRKRRASRFDAHAYTIIGDVGLADGYVRGNRDGIEWVYTLKPFLFPSF